MAEYENVGGVLMPKLPTPDMCAGAKAQSGVQTIVIPQGERSVLGTVVTLGALAGVGTLIYFILKK